MIKTTILCYGDLAMTIKSLAKSRKISHSNDIRGHQINERSSWPRIKFITTSGEN